MISVTLLTSCYVHVHESTSAHVPHADLDLTSLLLIHIRVVCLTWGHSTNIFSLLLVGTTPAGEFYWYVT